ncbi:MAG TPA: hypothetical protein VF303_01900 [Candidatus Nanoarchaeia archaeon]
MKRKQIYLTETLNREISAIAKKEDKPQSVVIRELLESELNSKSTETSGDVLLRIAAKATVGPGDLSTNIDSYLYGDKSPNYGKRTVRRR